MLVFNNASSEYNSTVRDLIIIAHNLRSSHNIGSLLRTAEGAGVKIVYLTGYTPYPNTANDTRLPHIANKVAKQIKKTALRAEETQPWKHETDIKSVINHLRADGYLIAALEQNERSTPLPSFTPPSRCALILGREVEGIEESVLSMCDQIVEIPMYGRKESFNVVQAAAMAIYHINYLDGPIH